MGIFSFHPWLQRHHHQCTSNFPARLSIVNTTHTTFHQNDGLDILWMPTFHKMFVWISSIQANLEISTLFAFNTETVCFYLHMFLVQTPITFELSPIYFPRLTTLLQHSYCRFKIQTEGAQAFMLGYVTSVLWPSHQCLWGYWNCK